MKIATLLGFLGLFYVSHQARANDALFELESRRGDIVVMYERTILKFPELHHLKSQGASEIEIVVTTSSQSPSSHEYEAARAYAESLKASFPNTTFTIGMEGVFQSDYHVVVEAFDGGDVSNRQTTIYGSRATGVRCAPGAFENSVECRENSSAPVPMGTRTVQTVDRYVDVEITFIRWVRRNSTNGMEGSNENDFVLEASGVARDSFTVDYEAGACANDVSAVGVVAAIVASNPTADRPRKFRFQSNARNLRCNDR